MLVGRNDDWTYHTKIHCHKNLLVWYWIFCNIVIGLFQLPRLLKHGLRLCDLEVVFSEGD